jgi:hypothetical protein
MLGDEASHASPSPPLVLLAMLLIAPRPTLA